MVLDTKTVGNTFQLSSVDWSFLSERTFLPTCKFAKVIYWMSVVRNSIWSTFSPNFKIRVLIWIEQHSTRSRLVIMLKLTQRCRGWLSCSTWLSAVLVGSYAQLDSALSMLILMLNLTQCCPGWFSCSTWLSAVLVGSYAQLDSALSWLVIMLHLTLCFPC